MRHDDVELDIGGLEDDDPPESPGPSSRSDDPSPRDARRSASPAPWIVLALVLGTFGVVLGARVLGPTPYPGVIAEQPDAPTLAWQAALCARGASAEVAGDVVLIRGPSCVQGLDLRTGEVRWHLGRSYITCEYADGPVLACLAGDAGVTSILTVEVATGAVTERDAGDVDAVVALGRDLLEARVLDRGIELRRSAEDGSEVWARVVDVDPEMVVYDVAGFSVRGPVMMVWGSEPTFVDTSDGSDVVDVEMDITGALVATGPADVERRVRGSDGQVLGTLVPGQVLPLVGDDLDGDVVLVSDPPTLDRGPETRVVARDRAGHDLWDLPRGAWPLAVVGDVVVLTSRDVRERDEMVGRDAATGEELWRSTLGGERVGSVWTDGQRLIVAADDSTEEWLVATDLASGAEVWQVRVARGPDESVVDVAADGSAIVVASETVAVWR